MPNLCEKYEFTILPRHYHNTQVFTEMPRHLRKCQNYDITANIYTPKVQQCQQEIKPIFGIAMVYMLAVIS
jgi:hypothetical protein